MDERTAKALDFAGDAVKQVLTLSTAIAGATILLSESLFPDKSPSGAEWLRLGWLFYLLSIVAGAWTLYKLAESLSKEGEDWQKPDVIWKDPIRIPAALQLVFFLLATVFITVFGWFAL